MREIFVLGARTRCASASPRHAAGGITTLGLMLLARPRAAGGSTRWRRMSELVTGADGRPRCPWGASPPDYVRYHDEEWGRPVHGADALYERLCLEAFQSGLSWLTILRKRETFRAAFAGFGSPRSPLRAAPTWSA